MQLAVLADRMDELNAKPDSSGLDITEYINHFKTELAHAGGIMDINIFPINLQFQLQFLNELITTIYEKNLWHNARYKECLDEYVLGIQEIHRSKFEETVDAYGTLTDYYKSFMIEHEYIMENYLVNYVFSTLFPISGKETMFDKVLYMGILFSLIRMHLIGMSASKQDLNTDIVVKLIQSFTKNFDHMEKFKQIIAEKCHREQISLGHLSLLIMN
jgi:lysine-N-methylase